ncbi:unnamed protein product [Victoria cruziana]
MEEEEEEEEGDMDAEMDERDECFSYPCPDVDLDYEFSAPRFYDFTRFETPDELREAEAWFETAHSYPPSPYLSKLRTRENLQEVNCTVHDDSVHLLANHSMTNMCCELSPIDEETNEHSSEFRDGEQSSHVRFNCMYSFPQSSCNSTASDNLIGDTNHVNVSKTAASSRAMACDTGMEQDPPRNRQRAPSRISTLMKPTASQLAKHKAPVSNFSRELSCSSRIFRRDANKHESGVEKTLCDEFQASKRLKLEGGHLQKVQPSHDMKQGDTLLHKASRKNGCIENTHQGMKLRLTVPREPELKTAQRAGRIRVKASVEHGENMHAKVPLFKARPLNSKIFESPSLPLPQKSKPRLPVFEEFHLRTWERALQRSMGDSSRMSCFSTESVSKTSNAVTTSARVDTRPSHCPSNDLHPKSKVPDVTKHVINGQSHVFKATPLKRKILLSGGDFSIHQNSKREAAKPMTLDLISPIPLLSCSTSCPSNLKFSPIHLKRSSMIQTICLSSNLQMCKGTKENVRALHCREHMVVSVGEERRETLKMEPNHATGDLGVAEMSCYTFI